MPSLSQWLSPPPSSPVPACRFDKTALPQVLPVDADSVDLFQQAREALMRPGPPGAPEQSYAALLVNQILPKCVAFTAEKPLLTEWRSGVAHAPGVHTGSLRAEVVLALVAYALRVLADPDTVTRRIIAAGAALRLALRLVTDWQNLPASVNVPELREAYLRPLAAVAEIHLADQMIANAETEPDDASVLLRAGLYRHINAIAEPAARLTKKEGGALHRALAHRARQSSVNALVLSAIYEADVRQQHGRATALAAQAASLDSSVADAATLHRRRRDMCFREQSVPEYTDALLAPVAQIPEVKTLFCLS